MNLKKIVPAVLVVLVVAIGLVALLSPTPASAAPKICATVRCAGCPRRIPPETAVAELLPAFRTEGVPSARSSRGR
jgi:hypothetical protein